MNKTKIWLTAIAIVLIIIYIFPVYSMVMSSLENEKDIMASRLIPSELHFNNYSLILEKASVIRWFINSLVVSIISTAGIVAIAILAAYALGRMNFPGRKLLYIFVLAGFTIPLQTIMIPLFLELKTMGFVNSYWGLILPGLASPLTVFILANFFKEIPNDYEEAARIDGASEFTILTRVVIPMSIPAIASVTILNFTWTWNDYLWPLVIATSEKMYTLPVGLATLAGSDSNIRFGPIMAANVLASIPVLIFFMLFQKNLISGVSVGSGVK